MVIQDLHHQQGISVVSVIVSMPSVISNWILRPFAVEFTSKVHFIFHGDKAFSTLHCQLL